MPSRSKFCWIPGLALLFAVGLTATAHAEAPHEGHAEVAVATEGAHGEAGHEAGHEAGGHAAEGDHWSLVSQLMPGVIPNVQHALGKTWIEGSDVQKVAHIFMALIVLVVLLFAGFAVSKRLTRPDSAVVPDTKLSPVTFFEMIVGGVMSMLQTSMGLTEKKARQVLPLVATLAAFILLSNLLGMIPGLLPPTDNLNTTLALGLIVFLTTHYIGIKQSGIAYFKHFFGPIIAWYALPLMLLMFIIEMISHVARPISLALRLMGNMFGDHKVLGIFLGFGFILVPLPIMLLGLLVAIVQTLVFCLLTMVYFSIALAEAEHH